MEAVSHVIEPEKKSQCAWRERFVAAKGGRCGALYGLAESPPKKGAIPVVGHPIVHEYTMNT